jgi:hypothetical protein
MFQQPKSVFLCLYYFVNNEYLFQNLLVLLLIFLLFHGLGVLLTATITAKYWRL